MSLPAKTKVVRFGKASGPRLLQKSSFFEQTTNFGQMCNAELVGPWRELFDIADALQSEMDQR